MDPLSKKIDTDDLICVSSTPQSLQDQNCLSVFYKEFSDAKKTKFKIAEFKLACARSVSKLVMIEKLRLNVKEKFTFDHLKLAGEVSAEEYFKGLVNKPQQVYQAIKIIYFVYFYKNAFNFFSVFKKKFNREKNVSNREMDRLLNKQPNLNINSNCNDNLIKISSNKDNLEEFIVQKKLKNLENEKIFNTNNNIPDINKVVDIFGTNREINDSNLFGNENNENNSIQFLSNNSRVKIYKKRDSREGFDDVLMHNDINFNVDSEHLKESENNFKKIILQNQNQNENDQLKVIEPGKNLKDNLNYRDGKLNNFGNSKDNISFVI
jgi:hypothetical protein